MRVCVITTVSRDPIPHGPRTGVVELVYLHGPPTSHNATVDVPMYVLLQGNGCRFKKERSQFVTQSVMVILRKHAIRVRDVRETFQVRVIS